VSDPRPASLGWFFFGVFRHVVEVYEFKLNSQADASVARAGLFLPVQLSEQACCFPKILSAEDVPVSASKMSG
jgi:hypothetical protein